MSNASTETIKGKCSSHYQQLIIITMNHISILIFCVFTFSLFSQDVLVEDANNPEAEFHAAINPTDTNNIVLATQNDFGGTPTITIYYTLDFGNTWSISNYHGTLSGYNISGDAVLSYNSLGEVFLVNLAASDTEVNTILSKSSDGGATWSLVSTVESGFTDKPWFAIDRHATSPHQGNMYVPLVTNVISLYTLDDNYQVTNSIALADGEHLPSVVVKKDGTVFTSSIEMASPNVLYVQEYSNGGTTLVHSTQVVSFPDYLFSAPDVSLRFQPTAYLAMDNSGGSYDGRLYLSYTGSEAINPDYFNIFLMYSDDNGLTWSTPSVVHSDIQSEVQQFYSSMYVNDNGVLILDWYDRKNYTNTNKLTDFFMGVSHDGGSNFAETQLNTLSSDFNYVIPSSGDFGIGEYHQLVATNHTAVSFWSDGRTNDEDLNIYMAKVNINGPLAVEESSLVTNKIGISSLYPNPAYDVVFSDIDLTEAAKIKYDVINASGQVITKTDWVQYSAGQHTLEFRVDVPTGVYFINLVTDSGYFKTMKIVKP